MDHSPPDPRQQHPAAGYSLVELVMVIAIAGVVSLVPAQVLLDSMKVYSRTAPRIQAAYQSGLAVERMKRDFRDLASYDSISVMTSSSLTFDDSDGTAAYALSGSDLTRNGDLIASNVSALTLTYRDEDGANTTTATEIRLLEIDLTVTMSGQPYRSMATVFPRDPTESAGWNIFDEAAAAATAYIHNDDHFHVDLVSLWPSDLEIESIELSADNSPPNFKEFKLDSHKIIKDLDVELPTGIVAINAGNTSQRTLEAGDDPEARIKFKDDFDEGTTNITLVVHFTDGSSDSITFSVSS